MRLHRPLHVIAAQPAPKTFTPARIFRIALVVFLALIACSVLWHFLSFLLNPSMAQWISTLSSEHPVALIAIRSAVYVLLIAKAPGVLSTALKRHLTASEKRQTHWAVVRVIVIYELFFASNFLAWVARL